MVDTQVHNFSYDFPAEPAWEWGPGKRSSISRLPTVAVQPSNCELGHKHSAKASKSSKTALRKPGKLPDPNGLRELRGLPETLEGLHPELGPEITLVLPPATKTPPPAHAASESEPSTVTETMRITSWWEGSAQEDSRKKKGSWKRERLAGLAAHIPGVPEVELLLPSVFSSDQPKLKAGIFNAPADIEERLKRRDARKLRGSRKSAASIPAETRLPRLKCLT